MFPDRENFSWVPTNHAVFIECLQTAVDGSENSVFLLNMIAQQKLLSGCLSGAARFPLVHQGIINVAMTGRCSRCRQLHLCMRLTLDCDDSSIRVPSSVFLLVFLDVAICIPFRDPVLRDADMCWKKNSGWRIYRTKPASFMRNQWTQQVIWLHWTQRMAKAPDRTVGRKQPVSRICNHPLLMLSYSGVSIT